MNGRVIHTGQAIVDLVMSIEALPEAGGDTFARDHEFTAGGGFNVMAAAARDGADVVYVGGHGTGPFGDIVRTAMSDAGIQVPASAHPHQDTGFCVALVEDSAERTFVSTLGAEGHVGVENYRAGHALVGDVVYVTGYSLLHKDNCAALLAWLPELDPAMTVVVDPSPVIGEVPLEVVRAVAARSSVWSTNLREAKIVAAKLGLEGDALDSELPALDGLASRLAAELGCSVIIRAGELGAVVASDSSEDVAPARVPALRVTAIDTNGAGDAHSGVLCAALARGEDLLDATRRANVAAALAVTKRGPATAPTGEEIDKAL